MELSDDVRKGLGALADPKRFQPAQFGALVAGTAECLASGREAAEPDLTAMLQRPMVEHDTEHRRAQDVETQAHGFEVVRLGAPVDHEQHAICFAGES